MQPNRDIYGAIDATGQRWVFARHGQDYRPYRINQSIVDKSSFLLLEHFLGPDHELDSLDHRIAQLIRDSAESLDPTLTQFETHSILPGKMPGEEKIIAYVPSDTSEFSTFIAGSFDSPLSPISDKSISSFCADFAQRYLTASVTSEDRIKSMVSESSQAVALRHRESSIAALIWYSLQDFEIIFRPQKPCEFFVHLIATARLAEIIRINDLTAVLVRYNEDRYLQYLGVSGLADCPGARAAWASAEAKALCQ